MAASAFARLSSPTASVKLAAIKDLRVQSELDPEALYPQFDRFAGLLRHENSVLRWNAMLILGNLARIDTEGRIDGILDDYLAPIPGPHLIDAANTIKGATAIAAMKPHLAERIATAILAAEHGEYATPECRNVAIGHALKALARLYPELQESRRAIRAFAERQCENPRPAARRAAQALAASAR